MLTDLAHRQPSRRKLMLIRLGLLVSLILLSPLALVLRLRLRPGDRTAFGALDARVRDLWQTSAHDAVALLRATFEKLRAGGAIGGMKRIQIEPFGKFQPWDALKVEGHLYQCELALGHHEAALELAASLPKSQETVLQQVDCLLAMGRRADAVALLERNLDLDSWRGALRRRLTALGGSPLRSVN
jgi:hypothetical protein